MATPETAPKTPAKIGYKSIVLLMIYALKIDKHTISNIIRSGFVEKHGGTGPAFLAKGMIELLVFSSDGVT